MVLHLSTYSMLSPAGLFSIIYLRFFARALVGDDIRLFSRRNNTNYIYGISNLKKHLSEFRNDASYIQKEIL